MRSFFSLRVLPLSGYVFNRWTSKESTLHDGIPAGHPVTEIWRTDDVPSAGRAVKEWAEGDFTLVLGKSPSNKQASNAIAQAIFARIAELLLDRANSGEGRTWLFLDEAREAGKF